MRLLGITLALTAALVMGPFDAAMADDVVVGVQGTASTHAAGKPTTAEPWRTVTTSSFVGDGVRHEWTGTVTLAGPVPTGSSIVVNWGIGIQHPNGCEVLISFAEQEPTVASDNTITVTRTYNGSELSEPYTCLSVVLSTNGENTDVVTGPLGPHTRISGVEAKPAGGRFLVAAGRSTPTIVMVTSHVRASSGATVTSSGDRIAPGAARLGAISVDRARPVVLRVDADRAGRSRLELSARDDRDSSDFDARWRVVARELESQRPLPGRYETTDGSLHFRVTDDFEVRRLNVKNVPCDDSSLTYSVRLARDLELPRSGATARVIRNPDPQFGDGFYAAQLLTVSPRRVVGSFSVATYGCTGTIKFAARRQE